MGIIDEKGRIFGRINVIDFLVVLFLLFLLPVFYFGYKIAFKKPAPELMDPDVLTEMIISCEFVKVDEETVKKMTVGDKALDANSNIIGEIISIKQNNPYQYEISERHILLMESSKLRNIYADVLLNLVFRDGKLYYDGKVINQGSLLKFKTDRYTCNFIPFADDFGKGERKVDIPVVLKDLNEDILKLISAGDKEIDEYGNVLAEIITIGQIERNTLNVEIGKGYIVEAKETNKRQVPVIMRMKCIITDERAVYYKDRKILNNEDFVFQTDKYSIRCVPTVSYEEGVKFKKRWLSIIVKFTNLQPEIVSVVKAGDKEEDIDNLTVAVISRIVENKPTNILMLKDSVFVELNHPFQKDLTALLEVECIEKDSVHYFKNYPVRMGNTVVFSTNLYSITGTVIGVEVKDAK